MIVATPPFTIRTEDGQSLAQRSEWESARAFATIAAAQHGWALAIVDGRGKLVLRVTSDPGD